MLRGVGGRLGARSLRLPELTGDRIVLPGGGHSLCSGEERARDQRQGDVVRLDCKIPVPRRYLSGAEHGTPRTPGKSADRFGGVQRRSESERQNGGGGGTRGGGDSPRQRSGRPRDRLMVNMMPDRILITGL